MKMNEIKLNENDLLFTTGAFIKPIKVVINNQEQWRWIVTSFEDQTFSDGNEIDVYTYANNPEDLLDSALTE
jgi:hypothetical protein